jgi:hypothetical protein
VFLSFGGSSRDDSNDEASKTEILETENPPSDGDSLEPRVNRQPDWFFDRTFWLVIAILSAIFAVWLD